MKHDYDFDPTYGYDLDALLQVGAPDAPADFEAFWRETYEQAMAVPPRPTVTQIDQTDRLTVYEVDFDSWGGVRLGGWLTVPREGDVMRGIVFGHGYGGRDKPDLNVPGPPAAVLFPCIRGFHRSAKPDLPSTAARHVIHGIKSRETYLHRGSVADVWAAASALVELYPGAADCLDFIGGSFCGGIGALALPWDDRFRRAALRVPSFGNHPLRVTLPCRGSGEAVRAYIRHHSADAVLDVLAYFDAAVAARWLEKPTLCQCALFDPKVPPPGQFAVYNCLAGARSMLVRKAGHFDYPEQAEEDRMLHEHTAAWFAASDVTSLADARDETSVNER
ncbi:acetylxylan esterase [Phycisphaerales bacterium AB-hyl4]|uniref:Acetylxylan esterase n=1 Tax=Natronomicrosphaera hydrolytica TaxID=3242702 RepID=A0ABV4UA26_9BACT